MLAQWPKLQGTMVGGRFEARVLKVVWWDRSSLVQPQARLDCHRQCECWECYPGQRGRDREGQIDIADSASGWADSDSVPYMHRPLAVDKVDAVALAGGGDGQAVRSVLVLPRGRWVRAGLTTASAQGRARSWADWGLAMTQMERSGDRRVLWRLVIGSKT